MPGTTAGKYRRIDELNRRLASIQKQITTHERRGLALDRDRAWILKELRANIDAVAPTLPGV